MHRLRKRRIRKWRRQRPRQFRKNSTTTIASPPPINDISTTAPIDIDQPAVGTEAQHMRSKRSISSPRHVEALVVADSSMVAFHQDDYVETYLLTIMNMVSSLYKDPAIGNSIKVVVVRIVLLEEDESHPDFNITHVAENNLLNFCR